MSDITPDLPAYVDDSGTGRDGTVGSKAWFDAWKTAINNQVLSATNPSLKPKDTIDEVKTARGAAGTLDGRLDVSLNENGTLKSSALASYATIVQVQGGLGAVNLVGDDDFLIWPAGDAAAPTLWVLAGGGATIARTGSGLGDTTRKIGDFCAKVTRVGNDATLTQALLIAGTSFPRADFLKGQTVGIGCWVWSATPNIARIAITDGVLTTTSAFHTGNSTWQWLSALHTISGSATNLQVRGEVVSGNGSGYFSGFTAMLIPFAPTQYAPCPTRYDNVRFSIPGAVTTGTDKDRHFLCQPGIVKDVQLHVSVAPTGQALIVDMNTWDGAAYTTMYTTKPQIAAGGFAGAAQPDTTYARRCMVGMFNSTPTGSILSFDVDQVGSGAAGSNLSVLARILSYERPLHRFLNWNE